jgi:hypothetical protein
VAFLTWVLVAGGFITPALCPVGTSVLLPAASCWTLLWGQPCAHTCCGLCCARCLSFKAPIPYLHTNLLDSLGAEQAALTQAANKTKRVGLDMAAVLCCAPRAGPDLAQGILPAAPYPSLSLTPPKIFALSDSPSAETPQLADVRSMRSVPAAGAGPAAGPAQPVRQRPHRAAIQPPPPLQEAGARTCV